MVSGLRDHTGRTEQLDDVPTLPSHEPGVPRRARREPNHRALGPFRLGSTAHDLDQRARERVIATEIAAVRPSQADVARRRLSNQIRSTTGAARVLNTAGELLLAMGILVIGPLVVPSMMAGVSGDWSARSLVLLLLGPGAIILGGLLVEAGDTLGRRDIEVAPFRPQPANDSVIDRERLVRRAEYH